MSLKHQGKAALLPSQTLSAQCLVNIERHCLLIDGHVSEASYKCKPCGFLFSKQNPIIYNLNQDPGSYPFQNCQIPLKKSRSAHRLNEGVFVHTECHFIYSFTHGLSFIFTLWLYVMSFLFSDLHGRGNSLSSHSPQNSEVSKRPAIIIEKLTALYFVPLHDSFCLNLLSFTCN